MHGKSNFLSKVICKKSICRAAMPILIALLPMSSFKPSAAEPPRAELDQKIQSNLEELRESLGKGRRLISEFHEDLGKIIFFDVYIPDNYIFESLSERQRYIAIDRIETLLFNLWIDQPERRSSFISVISEEKNQYICPKESNTIITKLVNTSVLEKAAEEITGKLLLAEYLFNKNCKLINMINALKYGLLNSNPKPGLMCRYKYNRPFRIKFEKYMAEFRSATERSLTFSYIVEASSCNPPPVFSPDPMSCGRIGLVEHCILL